MSSDQMPSVCDIIAVRIYLSGTTWFFGAIGMREEKFFNIR